MLAHKSPSKNLVFTENPSKNPSKKHLLLENLLRTLLRSVLLHDPPLVCTLFSLGQTGSKGGRKIHVLTVYVPFR